ncbi:MAG: aldo/keto reductase [Desulfobacterota bacterium]|nr:aldo/keto reductase [Thermodesulfobacteriota bacterium]
MQYRRLRGTHLDLSRVAYGGLALYYQHPDAAIELINAAIDRGINYFDCDEAGNQFVPNLVYEDTRKKLGQVLKNRRNEVYVGIKCMFARADEVARDIDKALNFIVKGTSREIIDIFHFAHVDVDEKLDLLLSPDGGLAAAERAKQEGKIGSILIASHNPRVLMRALKTGRFDVAEFPFTIIEPEYLDDVIPYCADHNIGTIIMKPIGGGQLAQCASLSLRWIAQHDVDCIIPGMKSLEEIEQNITAVIEGGALSAEELSALTEISQHLGAEYCHRCGYCLPCPQGIHIISQFDIYKSTLFGIEKKQEIYRQMKARGTRTAADCIGCGQCVEKCPFKLPVPSLMERVERDLGGVSVP